MMPAHRKPRVGISTCLLGQPVRYDGGHKHNRPLVESLGRQFDWVPVCPEVELGLGVPREPIQLIESEHGVRLRSVRGGRDLTERMVSFAARRVRELAREKLSGFLLQQNSPSCGLRQVAIHGPPGTDQRPGRGLFAEALLARWPDLPVAEEGDLSDPRALAGWIERVLAHKTN